VTGAFPWVPQHQPDQVSDSAQLQRSQAFAALEPVRLQPVPESKLQDAVESMALPAEGRQALLQDVGAPAVGPQAAASAPQAALAPSERVRLAWITLWDTDVQDGDIVRIDSRGYSKTVTLTKGGETFAVPVPADGIITVTGIKDGDGGGITVGLASGGVKAVFPVMSTGQSLALRVAID
jgi:hypothetical protein